MRNRTIIKRINKKIIVGTGPNFVHRISHLCPTSNYDANDKYLIFFVTFIAFFPTNYGANDNYFFDIFDAYVLLVKSGNDKYFSFFFFFFFIAWRLCHNAV